MKNVVIGLSLVAGLLVASVAVAAAPAKAPAAAKAQKVEMSVTSDGYVPAQVKAKVGQPLTLSITRKVQRTCATEIVIKDYGINQTLPLDKTVEVTITPKKAGKIRFACAMDMIAGEIVAE